MGALASCYRPKRCGFWDAVLSESNGGDGLESSCFLACALENAAYRDCFQPLQPFSQIYSDERHSPFIEDKYLTITGLVASARPARPSNESER